MRSLLFRPPPAAGSGSRIRQWHLRNYPEQNKGWGHCLVHGHGAYVDFRFEHERERRRLDGEAL